MAPVTMTSVLREIFGDVNKGIRTPISSFKAGSASQRSTGGFGVVSSGIDLFTSNDGILGKALTTAEGAASLAVIFSANPYLLFGVSAWFVGKALFNAATKGLPALFKGNITEAGMVFGKSALDIAFNCSALKIFKQFGISKILNTGLAARSEASMAKLALTTADDAAVATTKLAESTTAITGEVKAAQKMLVSSRKSIIATETQIASLAEKQAAAKLATEAAEVASKEAAEALLKNATDEALKKAAKEAADKLVEAKAKEAALIAEKAIAEEVLKSSKQALTHAKDLLKNRRAALKDVRRAEELFKANGNKVTDEIVTLQNGAIKEELGLKASDLAYDMTRAGFGDEQATAAANMANGVKGVFKEENLTAAMSTVKGTVSRVVPQKATTIPTYGLDNIPDNLDPLKTYAIVTG